MAGRPPLQQKEVDARLRAKFKGRVVPISPYCGYAALRKYQCTTCLNEWEQTPERVLVTRNGCPACGFKKMGEKLRSNVNDYTAKLAKVHPDITLVGPFNGTGRSTLFRHVCGHEWKVTPAQLLNAKCGCTVCAKKMAALTSTKRKQTTIAGHAFTTQGSEGDVINWLVSAKGIQPTAVYTSLDSELPVIPFFYEGKLCHHYPDLLVKGVVIEVKSTWTLGLVDGAKSWWWDKNKAKATMAAQLGIPYRVAVVFRNKEVRLLPSDWFNQSKSQVKKGLFGK